MPRYARIHLTGGLFHVVSRFHDKRFFFDLEGAREKYLELLGRAAAKHDSRILAYCLMSSHVHLVIQLGGDPLGGLFRSVHSGFGPWLNSARGGSGPVFAGRPKGTLVHSETYGLEVVRYVHNNPVRAGVVGRAAESGWSSHRAYLGLEEAPAWLVVDAILGAGEQQRARARAELASFVDEGRGELRRPELVGEMTRSVRERMTRAMGGEVKGSVPVLGPDGFVLEALRDQAAAHQKRNASAAAGLTAGEAVAAVFSAFGLEPGLAANPERRSELARARAVAAYLWSVRLGKPQTELADALRRTKAAITGMLERIRQTPLDDRERRIVDGILEGDAKD